MINEQNAVTIVASIDAFVRSNNIDVYSIKDNFAESEELLKKQIEELKKRTRRIK